MGSVKDKASTKPVLLLRLEGPLQSWGIRSRWDLRDTAQAPTKSGLIGLLGCALGYERGDERLSELEKSLRLGVRVEHPGRAITDYQTITDYLPTAAGAYKLSGSKTISSLGKARADNALPATIISPRAYLEDAAFLAAFEAVDGKDSLLSECATALSSPKWPLFLGRKSCVPTRPIFDAVQDGLRYEYSGIEEALSCHPWDWRKTRGEQRKWKEKEKSLRVYIEDSKGEHFWQDTILPGTTRLYGFRAVREGWIPFAHLSQQQDGSINETKEVTP